MELLLEPNTYSFASPPPAHSKTSRNRIKKSAETQQVREDPASIVERYVTLGRNDAIKLQQERYESAVKARKVIFSKADEFHNYTSLTPNPTAKVKKCKLRSKTQIKRRKSPKKAWNSKISEEESGELSSLDDKPYGDLS